MPSPIEMLSLARGREHAAAALALCVGACDAPEKPLVHSAPVTVSGRVKVLNADTLVIDGRHVHLSNASAPQSVLHAHCWSEALLATDELAFVKDLVDHALTIDFKPSGQVDDYNRDLGLVRLDGMDLGDELYNRGMAARLTEPRFDWCRPVSEKAEGAPPMDALIKLGQ